MTVTLLDPGGYVMSHYWYGKTLAMIGAKVKVVFCASACILWLIPVIPKENVCFTRTAWIGYHTAAQHNNPDGTCCTESTTTMRWERGSDMIARGKYTQC